MRYCDSFPSAKLGIPLALILSVSLSACTPEQNGESSTAAGSVRVGLLVPLTGGAASYGQNARKGAELALQEFRTAHPEFRIDLRTEDSRGEPQAGNIAASKLINAEGVVAIIGDVTSSVTLAAAPLANERRVPLVSPGASDPKVTGAGEYVFRTWPSDVFEAGTMAKRMAESGIKRLAVVHINNDYGKAWEQALAARLRTVEPAVEVVRVEPFEQGAREMRAQLGRLRNAAPDALLFVGYPESAVTLGTSLSNVGWRIPIFASSAIEDPQVSERVGTVLEGTVYTRPLTATTQRHSRFVEAYRAAYGEDPGVVAAEAYDAMSLVLGAAAAAHDAGEAVTGESIQRRLRQTRDYDGASGLLSFDENGDVVKPVGFYTLRGGRFQELTP
jgi:branched-chain amino acid transport system substrate-binding protein